MNSNLDKLIAINAPDFGKLIAEAHEEARKATNPDASLQYHSNRVLIHSRHPAFNQWCHQNGYGYKPGPGFTYNTRFLPVPLMSSRRKERIYAIEFIRYLQTFGGLRKIKWILTEEEQAEMRKREAKKIARSNVAPRGVQPLSTDRRKKLGLK